MRWLCSENGAGGGGEGGVTGGEVEPDVERVSICHYIHFMYKGGAKALMCNIATRPKKTRSINKKVSTGKILCRDTQGSKQYARVLNSLTLAQI